MKSTSLLHWGATLVSLIAAIPSPGSFEASASTRPIESRAGPVLPFGNDPISLFNLSTSFPPPVLQDAVSIEAIRNTLALYVFAIDGQNFAALGEIFSANVTANYSPPLNILTPLTAIQGALAESLKCVTTQHSFGTQLIQIRSLTTAFSVTYFRAMHFGKGTLANEVVEAYGQYQDTWQRQSNGKWKVVYRNLIYMGPVLGNFAIFVC